MSMVASISMTVFMLVVCVVLAVRVFMLVCFVVSHREPPKRDVEVIGFFLGAGTLNHGTAIPADP